ncbi:MAG: methionine--tRNA ligase [Candidatus Bostrichicola ureolyticus]|nr:MAG: methionine--tRNA ligase [Candidatus Bostrichicola ureolyticus]
MSNNRYTVTAALLYANGPIHIGHLAGVYIPADIFVRYLRRKNKDVIFICGSDEHGVPIMIGAQKEGISPKKIVDKYHFIIKNSFNAFGISFDNYSRTTSSMHHKTVTNFFKHLYHKNIFFEKTSKQFFDKITGKFLADRYILGNCPYCNNKAYGDQCEKCGAAISSDELINPISALSGHIPILKKTKHWYLPLDKYQLFLENWINNKKFWKTNVYGQVKSWLCSGLKSRSITRDLDWGVSVPLNNAKGKVLYVWFDALIGYISSTIEWAEREGKNWVPYWKNDNTTLIHFIGKDNIVFHCIVFPVMLKAHCEYILPQNVIANEFLNLENKKISTSKNWAVWLHEYLKDFPNQQDSLRYILTINMPETKDNNFNWKEFQIRINSELVSVWGNFVYRIMVITWKYCEGKVPTPQSISESDCKILQLIKTYPYKIGTMIEHYRFRDALIHFMTLVRLGNKYLTNKEPWKIFNFNQKNIIYTALQILGMLSQLAEPFFPNTTKILLDSLHLKLYSWNELEKIEILPPEHQLGEPILLFKLIENSDIEKQLLKLKNNF